MDAEGAQLLGAHTRWGAFPSPTSTVQRGTPLGPMRRGRRGTPPHSMLDDMQARLAGCAKRRALGVGDEMQAVPIILIRAHPIPHEHTFAQGTAARGTDAAVHEHTFPEHDVRGM